MNKQDCMIEKLIMEYASVERQLDFIRMDCNSFETIQDGETEVHTFAEPFRSQWDKLRLQEKNIRIAIIRYGYTLLDQAKLKFTHGTYITPTMTANELASLIQLYPQGTVRNECYYYMTLRYFWACGYPIGQRTKNLFPIYLND